MKRKGTSAPTKIRFSSKHGWLSMFKFRGAEEQMLCSGVKTRVMKITTWITESRSYSIKILSTSITLTFIIFYLLKLLKSIPDYLGAAEAAAWIACQFAKLVLREDVLPRLSDHDHLRWEKREFKGNHACESKHNIWSCLIQICCDHNYVHCHICLIYLGCLKHGSCVIPSPQGSVTGSLLEYLHFKWWYVMMNYSSMVKIRDPWPVTYSALLQTPFFGCSSSRDGHSPGKNIPINCWWLTVKLLVFLPLISLTLITLDCIRSIACLVFAPSNLPSIHWHRDVWEKTRLGHPVL